MTGLIMAAQLLLGLSILVVLHEFGHYLFARMFKIRVEQFYLFFNPKIALFRAKRVNGKWQFRLFAKNVPSRFRKKTNDQGNEIKDEKGNYIYEPIPLEELSDNDWRKYPETTEWGIGWLPFGGYCNIAGMIDENKRANQLSSEPQPWELRSKPAWQRLFVMIGGIIMNLVLGCALFVFFTYHYVGGYIANDDVSKDGIYVYEAGRNLGFETGDKIVTVNGEKIVRFGDAQKTKVLFGSEITVERDGQFIDITLPDTTYRIMQHSGNLFAGNNFPAVVDSVTPNSVAMRGGLQRDDHIIFINDKEIKSLGALQSELKNVVKQEIVVGVIRQQDTVELTMQMDSIPALGFINKIHYNPVHYTIGQSFKYGISDAMDMLSANVKGLGKIIKGTEKATESLQGPIGIATIYGGVWEWSRFWYITAMISLILAFMNILPIPALDGGHVVFILIEMTTGRKPSDKVLETAQIVGMVIVISLMFFVIGNDIFKLFR